MTSSDSTNCSVSCATRATPSWSSSKTATRKPTGRITITDVTAHNLKKVTVGVPAGVLTVVTGVAGPGKSTLVTNGLLAQHAGAIVIDQSPVATSIRSTPATYTGMMDDVRRLFARANKVSASLFSFNSTGACPNCEGLGVVYTDLAFLEGLKSTCEQCRGHWIIDVRHEVALCE